MGTALVTLPDGKKARVTFETQEQLDKTVGDLTLQHQNPDPKMGELTRDFLGRPHIRTPFDAFKEAVGEPALAAGTGAFASAVGGAEGLARGVGAGAASLASGEGLNRARQAFAEEATDTIEKRQEQLTRQPRTRIGRAATGVVSTPFRLLAEGADIAGKAVTDVTGSAELGAATNTTIQAMVPVVLGKTVGAGVRAMRGGARPGTPPSTGAPTPPAEMTATGAPRQPPTEVGAPPTPPAAPVPPDLSAQGAPRQAPFEVPDVPRGTPPGATPSPAAGAAATAQEARAQAYARSIGLDWARLGAGTRKALTTIAQDATALDRLNPAAVRRQAHLQSLRVPVQATRGQLERDPVQLRREAIASNTTEGQPIRDVDIAANRDLQANLEILRGRAGGLRGGTHEPLTEEGLPSAAPSIRRETKTPTQVGEAAQQAAREKAKWSKKGYEALYKIARETEPDAKAGIAPITSLLTDNPEIQHLGWVQSWLNKAAKVKAPAGGEPVAMTDATLSELQDLRSTATEIARTGGKEGYYAGQVVKAVNQAMEEVPAGAQAWKAANDAFRKHQQEFKDQAIVGKLVSQKKGGADRALALERTWNTVATGPLDQIRQVKRTLLTGGTPATRMTGRKAWRDIRAETVNRILEDARNVTAADETERAILTEAALRKSINRIPRENLEEILGKANVRELYDILRARRITTRSPVGGRTTQSGTVPNALVMAERVLKHIPGGKYLVGAKHVVQELGERGAATRAVEESTISPLEQAVRDVERASRKRATRRALEDLERAGPTLPSAAPSQPLPIGQALKKPPGP